MNRIFCLILFAMLTGCRPGADTDRTLIWATNAHVSRHDAVKWFEKENPGIRVRLMPISDPRQFFLQCIYGDAPDVITFFSADTFQTFAKNGLLIVLESGEQTPWPYYDALTDYCVNRKTNELMALPQVAYPYVLYFNPDIVPLKKAMAVHTWADLLSLIRQLLPAGMPAGKKVFGIDIHNEIIWFTTWYWQRGGRFFSREGKSILNRTIAQNTLDAMDRWRKLSGVLPRPSDRVNLPSRGSSQGVLGSLFLQGRALFYWSGSWKISDFENQTQIPWQVRCLPKGPVNALTVMGGNSFGVTVRARHPKAAKKLVTYLSSAIGQERHLSHRIFLPAKKSVPVPDDMSILKQQAQKAQCPEHSPLISEALLKEIFKQVLESHRLGVSDSKTAAAVLADALASGTLGAGHD
jgi:ABC-type glycerol-3-phosphate transport system substrate-binding protein